MQEEANTDFQLLEAKKSKQSKWQLMEKLWWQHPSYPELCSVHKLLNHPVHPNLYVTTALPRLLSLPSTLRKHWGLPPLGQHTISQPEEDTLPTENQAGAGSAHPSEAAERTSQSPAGERMEVV